MDKVKRVRRTALIRDSGPYVVKSRAHGVLNVYPAWPQFPEYNDEDGGGPGVLSRLALADDLERWLNGGKAL